MKSDATGKAAIIYQVHWCTVSNIKGDLKYRSSCIASLEIKKRSQASLLDVSEHFWTMRSSDIHLSSKFRILWISTIKRLDIFASEAATRLGHNTDIRDGIGKKGYSHASRQIVCCGTLCGGFRSDLPGQMNNDEDLRPTVTSVLIHALLDSSPASTPQILN